MTYKENIRAILECYFTGYKEEIINSACNRISELEPKTGHWVYDEERSDWFDITYECSCCKRTITVPYTSYKVLNEVYKDYPYCHCGAKMLEVEE